MKVLIRLALVLGLMAALTVVATPAQPASAASTDLLMLGSTLFCGGCSSAPEVQEAVADGLTYTVVDDATWDAMTTAQFASYKGLVLGDPDCGGIPPAAAASNASTWSAALTGDVLIAGTDPTFHTLAGNSGAQTLIKDGLNFAASQSGKTGAYIALSCYYGGASVNTPVPMLSGLGSFTVQGQNTITTTCPNNSHIVASSPALLGLSDADLSNWSCSTHEVFDSFPPTFSVLAIQKDDPTGYVATDGTVGGPYILARGPTLTVISNIQLTPATATQNVGTNETLTATVTENGNPVVGTTVTFTVLPGSVNAGLTGTAVTNASGQATFTYTSASTGTDFINAKYTSSTGTVQTSGNSQITWVAGGDTTAPSCALTAVIAGPPKQIQITVQDSDGGLAAPPNGIVVLSSSNATVAIGSYSAGTTTPVVVTATKIDQTLGASVALQVTDVAGNVTTCDPEIVSAVRADGNAVTQQVEGVSQADSRLTVFNDGSTVDNVTVTVNGHTFKLAGLKAGQRTSVDVSSALTARVNSVTVTLAGKPGSSATVLFGNI